MLPKTHLILTAIFSLLLLALGWATPLQAAIVLAAGVLIDTDHWFVYLFKKKDPSITRAYKWFYGFYERKEKRKFLEIFHTAEFFILIFLLSLKFHFFFFMLLGMLFHEVLDLIEAAQMRFYGKQVSLIYGLLDKKAK